MVKYALALTLLAFAVGCSQIDSGNVKEAEAAAAAAPKSVDQLPKDMPPEARAQAAGAMAAAQAMQKQMEAQAAARKNMQKQ